MSPFAAADAWLVAHGTSLLELAGFVSGLAYVWLVIRERLLAWPIGLLNAVAYAVLFRASGLYSDAGLQVCYAVLCVVGWWRWRRGARDGAAHATPEAAAHGADDAPLRITRTPTREAWALALVTLVTWALLAVVTARMPGTSLPVADAALVAGSLAAQWLTTRKRLATWALWIVVDAGYVVLFVVKALPLTALLYAVFLALAWQGHRTWRRAVEAPATPAASRHAPHASRAT